MSILDTLLGSAQAGSLNRAAALRGLDSGSAASLLEQLVPALTAQVKRHAGSTGGLDSLTSALKRGGHARYLEDPSALTSQAAVSDGNGILGHILGSKDASRNVAAHAARESGVDAATIRKMLPVVAAMAMGALSRQTDSGRRLEDDGGGLLGSLLDSNQDGQVLDDVISLARKLF